MEHGMEKLIIFYLTIAISIVFAFLFGHWNPDISAFFINGAFVVTSGLASLTAVIGLKRSGNVWRTMYSRIWLYYSLGTLLWFTEEMGLVIVGSLRIDIPFPSILHVLHLIGDILFVAGLGGYFFSFGNPFLRINLKTVAVPLSGVSILFSYLFLNIYSLITQGGAFDYILFFIFLFIESALAVFAILSMIVFIRQKRVGSVYLALGPGVIVKTIGDLLYLYSILLGTYYVGSPLDILFLFGYLVISASFLIHERMFEVRLQARGIGGVT